jgi:hypothetical protein
MMPRRFGPIPRVRQTFPTPRLDAGGFLVMAVIVGAVMLLLEFNHGLEIDSDPVLEDLVGAQSHLSRSYGAERNLLADSRAAHRELSGAIRQFSAVEQQYPAGNRRSMPCAPALRRWSTRGLPIK